VRADKMARLSKLASHGAQLGKVPLFGKTSLSLHPHLQMYSAIVQSIDTICVPICGMLAYYARFSTTAPDLGTVTLLALGVILILGAMKAGGFYDFYNYGTLFIQCLVAVFAWSVGITLLLAIVFFLGNANDYSRLWVLYWLILGVSASIAARCGMAMYCDRQRRAGHLTFNVAVIGSLAFGQYVMTQIMHVDRHVRLLGVFPPDGPANRLDEPATERIIFDILRLGRTTRVDEVIVELPSKRDRDFGLLVGKLSRIPCRVSLCPDLSDVPALPKMSGGRYRLKALQKTLMVGISERPLMGWAAIVKRAEDLILSSLLTLTFAPLMLLVAIGVKLDSRGPVLFRQPRFGFNNNVITVYKFRTMKPEAATDPTSRQAVRNDPRVTRLGKFLRRTSLDELPQLLNVIKGDMSLVGPRPHPIQLNEHFGEIIDGYLGRHRVKPGITGWAQINGFRGETSTVEAMEQRVKHDLYYIENWTLRFDLLILVRTLISGFVHPNAY
jgi:Undecaprenyl-phosphate glucose phosphotransferase